MTVWMMLTLAPALAGDAAVLKGKRCDARGRCTDLSIELYDTGRFLTSDGIAGTYRMPPGRDGTPTFEYDIGKLGGSIPSGPLNCWEEATSPLNPDLGSINVCLGIELQEFQPFSDSCIFGNFYGTYPWSDEDGHWAASLLDPESDYWVHEVSYHTIPAANGTSWNCQSLDHRVQVFLGDEGSPPPATPDVIFEFTQTDLDPFESRHRIDLPSQVFVPDGQVLWVSMEQIHQANGERTCIRTCNITPPLGESYWSDSDTTPFPWNDLANYGVPPLLVEAQGIYAP